MSKAALIPFFIVHYGIFWLVHGIFVLDAAAVRVARIVRPPHDLTTGFDAGPIPLAVLVLSHQPRRCRTGSTSSRAASTGGPRPRGQMFAPYGRLVVLHVTIIFGGMAIVVHRRAGRGGRGPRGLKTALDVGFHLAEHRKVATLPPGTVVAVRGLTLQSVAFEGSSMTAWVWASRQAARRSASASSPRARICGRQQPRVRGVADGDGRDRDAARHLDDRQQRVQAAQVLGRDRARRSPEGSSWPRACPAGGPPRRRPR